MMKDRFLKTNEIKNIKDEVKKVFFYRICGTGMGSAATLLKEQGINVHGADTDFFPPMSSYLERSGIPLRKISDCTVDYLNNFDLIIVGNVVPKNSEDAKMLESLEVPLTSFPQALGGLLLDEKSVVGISGTHGKTTTTYLGVQVFKKLGVDPGYLIGGVLPEGMSSHVGTSELFFIEADEYDTAYFEKTSKFLHYEIDHLILTSLEFDHADIFKDESEMLGSFLTLVDRDLENNIANIDYPLVSDVLRKKEATAMYGEDNSQFGPTNITKTPVGTSFILHHQNKSYQFETNLDIGHNILNLSSIILLALNLGYSEDLINGAIKNLQLVKRRQEVVGRINGAILIDDFAHHPTAIEKTLGTIRSIYPNKEIIAIFEPASSTARSDLFQERFIESFKLAQSVIVIPPSRKSTVISGGNLDIEKLAQDLVKNGKQIYLADNLKSLEETLLNVSNEKNVIITLSNGKVLNLFASEFIEK